MSPRRIVAIFGRTVVRMTPSLLAISFMVGLAFVTRYSGMDTVLGLSLTRTGPALPVLRDPARLAGRGPHRDRRGLERPLRQSPEGHRRAARASRPVLMAAANTSGGVMGKMIDAQSIVVAGAATQQVGREAEIFRAVIQAQPDPRSLVGVVVLGYAYLWPGVVPGP